MPTSLSNLLGGLYTGPQGISGYSGLSGYSGSIGQSGYSGISGYSGLGLSGYSGYSGVSGALSTWLLKTANFTATNNDRIIADTSSGTFTISLPATPVTGSYVIITDGGDFSTNNLTVGRNGSTIEGYSDDILLDLAGVTFEFIYNGNTGTNTWEVTATTGARGPAGTVTKTSSSIVSGTLTINLGNGYTVFEVSLNNNISTVSITNTPSSPGDLVSNFMLIFTADGTARTINWPTAVKWAGGTPPTPTSVNGKKDVYSFITVDTGTNWLASIVGQNY